MLYGVSHLARSKCRMYTLCNVQLFYTLCNGESSTNLLFTGGGAVAVPGTGTGAVVVPGTGTNLNLC